MRRLALAASAAAFAVAMVPAGSALAGGTTGTSSVAINQYADFDTFGTFLDVGLQVRCFGGTEDSEGIVTVNASQQRPDTSAAAEGAGFQDVVCDGRTHSVGVSVFGAKFDAGKALATATVTAPGNPSLIVAASTRQILVRVV